MKSIFSKITLAACALLGTALPAQSTILVTLSDGVTSRTCDTRFAIVGLNCGTGFQVSADLKAVNFLGAVGQWHIGGAISGFAGFSNTPGLTNLAKLDAVNLDVQNNTGTGATGSFSIRATAFNFTFPSGPALTLFGSASVNSSSTVAGSVASAFYADPSNGVALLNPDSCNMIIGTNNSCNTGTPLAWSRGAGPFSITQIQNFTFGMNQTVNTTQSLEVRNRIPEPGTTLLVGAALLGLALTSVHRKR